MAAYLARMYAVIRHGNITLDVLDDEPMMKLMQEKAAGTGDFSNPYQELRRFIMECDVNQSMGGLQRCHLASGRISWLCKEHQNKEARITVLASEGGTGVVEEEDLGLAEHLHGFFFENAEQGKSGQQIDEAKSQVEPPSSSPQNPADKVKETQSSSQQETKQKQAADEKHVSFKSAGIAAGAAGAANNNKSSDPNNPSKSCIIL
uniref:Uncharacterized protein LOC102802760 isoform X1 n=1 Tax=Saccoglossus kowalevskii TaxID=10224 RepID=A0ABM0MVI6_SACKO|nr:PREDICTED: uncharacterized protein LOC102802760 isoform X1 [Saccoglossus kowalevskii]